MVRAMTLAAFIFFSASCRWLCEPAITDPGSYPSEPASHEVQEQGRGTYFVNHNKNDRLRRVRNLSDYRGIFSATGEI
jgi:hypothetical protein